MNVLNEILCDLSFDVQTRKFNVIFVYIFVVVIDKFVSLNTSKQQCTCLLPTTR